MRSLTRFRSLPQTDKLLLCEAFVLVASIRMGLLLLPLSSVRSMASKARGRSRGSSTPASVGRSAWAIAAVSRRIPGATCLTQALAAQWLLARRGVASQVAIGVAKDAKHRFEAHAWLLCNSEIVVGGSEAERFTPMAVFEAR